jgi:hypothetical protein
VCKSRRRAWRRPLRNGALQGTESELLTHPVHDSIDRPSADLTFASAVAEFVRLVEAVLSMDLLAA